MGLFDFLFEVAGAVDELKGTKRYTAKCETFELFEIGSTWRGTARVKGPGNHIETIDMNISKELELPYEGTYQYTPRGLLRKSFRKWIGENFAYSGNIAKEMVMLNDDESCLSVDGYVKKVGGKWKLLNSSSGATNYGSFKVFVYDRNGDIVGHEELSYLFLEDTLGYITSVDVTDGF